jgi:hypothetical protein
MLTLRQRAAQKPAGACTQAAPAQQNLILARYAAGLPESKKNTP